MKIEKAGDNYLVNLTRDELLILVNSLAARQLLLREIAALIDHGGDKKKDDKLNRLQQSLAEALPAEVWDKKHKG